MTEEEKKAAVKEEEKAEEAPKEDSIEEKAEQIIKESRKEKEEPEEKDHAKKPEEKEDEASEATEEDDEAAEFKVKKEEKEEPESRPRERRGRGRRGYRKEFDVSEWVPKTKLGNDVLAGKYEGIGGVLEKGELILEPEIVDFMVPELMQEVIYIGGSPGKGGGIRRTATKMTARMHKSGRRFKLSALVVIGNGDGIVGVGRAISNEHRTAIEKATKNAKLSVIRVRRGCGSWECGCGGTHSVPFRARGKAGSVRVEILPAPKGVGIVASEEVRKVLKIAGIKDAWVKTSGMTSTRSNLVSAFFDALKKLNDGKGDL